MLFQILQCPFTDPDPVLSSKCQGEKNPESRTAGVSQFTDENEGLEGKVAGQAECTGS